MIALVSSSIKLSAWEGATEVLGAKGWSLNTAADIKLIRATINAKKTKTKPIPNRVKLIASLSKLLSIIDKIKKLILLFKIKHKKFINSYLVPVDGLEPSLP